MALQAEKLDLVQRLLGVQKASLIEKISALLDKEMTVGYTVDGKPLTKSAYDKRLQKAEQQISKGQFISQNDLESESENW